MEKILSSCPCVHHKSHGLGWGSNPDVRGMKLITNPLMNVQYVQNTIRYSELKPLLQQYQPHRHAVQTLKKTALANKLWQC